MKKALLAAVALCVRMALSGQMTFTVNYDWLKNTSWDRAVEVFNFSRTSFDPPLSYLTSGVSASLGYLKGVSSIRSTYVHFRLNGARYGTSFDAPQWNLRVRLFRLDAEAAFQFHPKALFRDVSTGPLGTRFFMNLGIAASTWQSRVEVNDERFFAKGKQPFIVRPSALLGWGYHWIILKKRYVITPRMGIRWFYRAEAPRFIESLAGTNITDLPSATGKAWLVETGMEFGFVPQTRRGKKGAARPCPTC